MGSRRCTMSTVLDGIGASEGIGAGRVHILHWGVPEVPHRLVEPDEVDREVEHLREVFEWAKKRLLDLEDSTESIEGDILNTLLTTGAAPPAAAPGPKDSDSDSESPPSEDEGSSSSEDEAPAASPASA